MGTKSDSNKVIKEINDVQSELAVINDYLRKEEADHLIKDAIKESKEYVDLQNRINQRKAKKEAAMNAKVARFSIIGLVLFTIFSIVFYLCAGSFDKGTETTATIIISGISACGIGLSLFFIISAIFAYNDFEKTEYIFSFRKFEDNNFDKEYTYKTLASSEKNAIKRFYKVYNYEEIYQFCMYDEFDNKYDNKGRICMEV